MNYNQSYNKCWRECIKESLTSISHTINGVTERGRCEFECDNYSITISGHHLTASLSQKNERQYVYLMQVRLMGGESCLIAFVHYNMLYAQNPSLKSKENDSEYMEKTHQIEALYPAN